MLNEIAAITECEDCGFGIICDPDFLSIEDFAGVKFISTLCPFCERPLIEEIDDDIIIAEFVEGGVKVI